MKRTVTYARIHEIKVALQGIGQLTTEFPPKNKTLPGLVMLWDGQTLEIVISDKSYGIPAANVQWLEFAKEKPEPVAAAIAVIKPKA